MTAADDRLQRAADAMIEWGRNCSSAKGTIAAAVVAAFADDFNDLDRLRKMALGEGVVVIDTKRDDELDRLRAENAALRATITFVEAERAALADRLRINGPGEA